jgi:hypothetical protein
MERLLTFIDCDENRLELRLKPDRAQLVVIDSRPELEAGELRRFASVMFAEYVAPQLGERLAEAQRRIGHARDRATGAGPQASASPAAPADRDGDLVAALDAAIAALGDLAAAMASRGAAELDAAELVEPEPVLAPLPAAAGRESPWPLEPAPRSWPMPAWAQNLPPPRGYQLETAMPAPPRPITGTLRYVSVGEMNRAAARAARAAERAAKKAAAKAATPGLALVPAAAPPPTEPPSPSPSPSPGSRGRTRRSTRLQDGAGLRWPHRWPDERPPEWPATSSSCRPR